MTGNFIYIQDDKYSILQNPLWIKAHSFVIESQKII